jgi:hypothetical protein
MLGCEEPAVRTERCTGALTRMVAWRDDVEQQRFHRKKNYSPTELARLEALRVEQVVELLQAESSCASVWRVQLFQEPRNPSLRLQEEAILRLLGEAPHDYGKKAVGWAGVTTSGRPPVGE